MADGIAGSGRIPLPDRDGMSKEQSLVFKDIVSGPRKRLVGPLRAALHNPVLASRWQEFGRILRYETGLSTLVSELAILVVGKHWNSQLEFYIHQTEALEAGLPPEILEAIRTGEVPDFAEDMHADVYEFVRLLLTEGNVPADLHARCTGHFGVTGVVELTALIGYYTMVAFTLNAHAIPLPDEGEPPLPPTTGISPAPPLMRAKGAVDG